MASVFIDIPGVGNVEAKNAATESTLRELVNIMKGGGGGGGGGSGPARSPSAGMLGSAGNAGAKAAGAAAGALGKSLSGLSKGLTAVTTGASMVWKGFNSVAMSATNLIDELANVGDSLSTAAGTLKNIPVVGGLLSGVLGAVAKAAESTVGAFQDAAKTGATFNGSVSEFARVSSQAGMTMKDFAGVLTKTGDGLLAFGGTSDSGAKNFANVSKQLRATGSDLYALGFSTKDINEGLGSYGKLLRSQGLQGTKTNAELAAGAKSYLKEMDLLAKATGQSRAEIEARQAALAKDAQFQAAMAGASDDVRKSFMAITTGMPKELETFTKDILANGTATTEENAKLLAQLPQSGAMLREMQAKMQRGEAVTLEERQALNNLMKEEGARNLKNIKQAGAASAELSGTVNALAATQTINADALKKGAKDQEDAAEKTDKMAEQVEKAKQSLAAFSNNFQMALANSGLLDTLMSAFGALANFVQTFIVPAFNLVAAVLPKIWSGFEMLLAPVIQSISEMLGGGGMGGALQAVNDVLNAVFPILNGVVRGAILAFQGLFDGISVLFEPFQNLFDALGFGGDTANGFADIIIEVGDYLGAVFRGLGGAIAIAVDITTSLINWFKQLVSKSEFLTSFFSGLGSAVQTAIFNFKKYMSKDGLEAIWQDLVDGFDSMIDGMLRWVNKLTLGAAGINEDELKERSEARANRRKEREEKLDAAVEEREAKKEEQKKQLAADTKKFQQEEIHLKKMGGLQKEEEDAKKKATESTVINYNDPIAMLKGEASRQNSGLIPATAKAADGSLAASAEASRKAMETEAEKQKRLEAELAARKAEDEKKKQESGGSSSPRRQAPGQESSESLLASLNTKLDQLIKVNRDYVEVAEAQLSVQKGLTGNLLKSA